ncbi:MAG: hypothetical protein MR372_09270 [Lachnospiraceae bacterium]|nr:hypothetical protein [Lachnospiraceae bacterium]MDY6222364.1 hypothetical protein [Candidatus Alectryocaccobium sp.]
MNETILMLMLVAIMVFFFIFGMAGYSRKERMANADDAAEVNNAVKEDAAQ